VESYWQRKIEVPGEKPVSLSLWQPQISLFQEWQHVEERYSLESRKCLLEVRTEGKRKIEHYEREREEEEEEEESDE
jgi:hypothetical protein